MKYKIIGNTVPAVETTLSKGEEMYTQSGAMVWQTEGIKMKTNTKGGILKGLARGFAGESIFMTTYEAEDDDASVAFATTVPGEIYPVEFKDGDEGIIVQKGAFLCAQDGVELKTILHKKLSSGLFGGEGFILQEINGKGHCFLEVDGDMVEKNLKKDEVILVSTGNVVAFDKSCNYEIVTNKGLSNIFFSGEGLFLTKLTGPGKVILQTQNFNGLSSKFASSPSNTAAMAAASSAASSNSGN